MRLGLWIFDPPDAVAFFDGLRQPLTAIYISTRIFENGTARLRCSSGVSRALFCRSETISKVGNIKIMSASSPFFFSPLSPAFSFLSSVVSRLMGVKKTQFRCRSGENGQIFRSYLFKNPGRYIYIYIYETDSYREITVNRPVHQEGKRRILDQ